MSKVSLAKVKQFWVWPVHVQKTARQLDLSYIALSSLESGTQTGGHNLQYV